MQRTKPPYRADHVGSLLRPAALKKAREQRAKGEMTPAQLKEIISSDYAQWGKVMATAGIKGE